MNINTSKKFDRQLDAILRKNRKFNLKVIKTLSLMNFDLRHPSLRLHKLENMEVYSASVDMKVRIIFSIDEDTIRLLEIGDHDDVY